MPTPDSQPDWLTTSEAMTILGVQTAATVRRWADRGHIRSFWTPGGHRRLNRADCERIAREGVARPTARATA